MKKAVTIAAAAFFIISSFSAPAFAADRHEVLVVGDEDEWVLELQKSLYDQGYLEFPATGFFGTDTQNAVIRFQKDNELIEDGKAGPETRELLLDEDYTEIPDTRVVEGYVKTTTTYMDNSLAVSDKLIGKIIKPASEKQQIEPAESVETPEEQPQSKSAPEETPAIQSDENLAQVSNDLLYPGDKGDAIAAVQTRLKELQYYDYPTITGYYGPVTEEAVKKFQRTHGLTEDGLLGLTTTNLLFSDDAKIYMMYPGDSGEDIRIMQEKLIELGYLNAEATGYYGDATVAAVSAFQDNNGLTVDGKAGQITRTLLYSGEAKPAQSAPAPSPDDEETQMPITDPTESPTPEPTESGSESAPEQEQQANPEQGSEQTAPAEETKHEVKEEPAPVSNAVGLDKVLEVAHAQIGKPYVYGANGPDSFDCSGFVYYTLKNSGIPVSRLSSASYATQPNWETIDNSGSLQVGDLVFFKSDSSDRISHIGIYLGGGSFIHSAPSSGGVAISSMTSGYYLRNYVTGKRIF